MQTTRYRTSSETNGIIFPRLESWNGATQTATIAVDVNKRRVLCRITQRTMEDRFGPSDDAPMQVLAQNRFHIQEVARRLIEDDAYEEDGSVIIRFSDL